MYKRMRSSRSRQRLWPLLLALALICLDAPSASAQSGPDGVRHPPVKNPKAGKAKTRGHKRRPTRRTPPGARPRATNTPPTDLSKVSVAVKGTPQVGRGLTVELSEEIVTAPQHSAWLIVSEPGTADEKYVTAQWIDPRATRVSMPAPEKAGEYELRLAVWGADGKVAHVAERITIQVKAGPAPTDISKLNTQLQKDVVPVGTPVVVEFDRPLVPDGDEQFWVTLVTPTADPGAYDAWKYVPFGAERVELEASGAGEWELRLHAHYPTKQHDIIWRAPVTVLGK